MRKITKVAVWSACALTVVAIGAGQNQQSSPAHKPQPQKQEQTGPKHPFQQLAGNCTGDGTKAMQSDGQALICRGGEWWLLSTDPGSNPWGQHPSAGQSTGTGTGAGTGAHMHTPYLGGHVRVCVGRHVRICL